MEYRPCEACATQKIYRRNGTQGLGTDCPGRHPAPWPTPKSPGRCPNHWQTPRSQADAETIQPHTRLSKQTPDSQSRHLAYLVDAGHPVQATSSSDRRQTPRQTSNSPGRRPTPRQTPKSPQSHARRPMQTTHSKEKGAHGTNPDAKLRSRYAAQHAKV